MLEMKIIDNNYKNQKCPLCGNTRIGKIGNINYRLPTYYSTEKISLLHTPELWKCNNCKSRFIQNTVSEKDAIELYKQGSSDERWSKYRFEEQKTKIAVHKFEELLNPNLRVLDIGCSGGEFLDFAKRRRCQTFGVEYSEHSLKLLKDKGHIAATNIQELKGNFDIITAFDVIEHLYDISKFLDTCLAKLSSNGLLLFLTGDISSVTAKITKNNWWYASFPEHIIFPSKTYFEQHKKVQLLEWIPTYAHSGYEGRPIINKLVNIGRELVNFKYTGHRSPFPDHSLIVLKSKQ